MASTILPKRHLKEFSKLDNIVHMYHSMIIKYIKCILLLHFEAT